MPLPDHLERLKHISIDTLGLSDSTNALLKWFSYTCILDCILFFHQTTNYTYRQIIDPWPRLYLLLFDEVKPALIAAGYWDLVMNVQVWHDPNELYKPYVYRRVVRWQGQDIDLYKIELPLEPLARSEMPAEFAEYITTIGACIGHFLQVLGANPAHWLDLGTYQASERPASEPLDIDDYMFGVVQPYLVELGYWRFVEEYIDDVIEEGRFWGNFRWNDDDEDT